MEKLVISWTSDSGYDSSFDHIICLEYENAEKFIIDFEEQIKIYINKIIENNLLIEQWEDNAPKQGNHKYKSDYQQKMFEYKTNNPYPTHYHIPIAFQLNYTTFSADDFVSKNLEIDLPEILTLEEWFQEKLKENTF